MRRTPLWRSGGLQRGKGLQSRSERRIVEDGSEEWADLRSAMRRRDGFGCRAATVWPEVRCSGPLDGHHVLPTGWGGPRLCPPADLIQLCRLHHRAVHDNIDRAISLGLLRRPGRLWD